DGMVWGPRSGRVIGDVPHGHWKTTTFVGALRTWGMMAPTVIDGAMNGDLFLADVQQQLVPTLRGGDIVVMDNLSSHKRDRVDVQTLYVKPGAPRENGYAESFHSRFRDEFLAMEQFESLSAAGRQTISWKNDYNEHRPITSWPGYTIPAEFATHHALSVRPTASLQQHGGDYPTRPS
ncbi:MAG: integrase core domain-containing protein, partial [Planctomycetaceae bacterium]|nr:integrase core domain-containing protein [Planctomycetaceae bacterium]